MATKKVVLDWFRSQLGYVEGPHNSTKYAAIAGHLNNQPWCATFLVAGFRSCGMKLPSESAYTPTMRAGFRKAGLAIPGPQVGALAFLYFPSLGRVAHVGIVEELRPDGRFVNIEGNTDVKGGRTGGRVMRKVRSTHNFTFVMPVYDKESAVTTPNHRRPNREMTKKIQTLLKVAADGEWGRKTDGPATQMRLAALHRAGQPRRHLGGYKVLHVQLIVGTKADGVWGPVSQAALVKWVKRFQEVVGVTASGYWDQMTDDMFKEVRSDNLNNF